jgi:hypothetical protein
MWYPLAVAAKMAEEDPDRLPPVPAAFVAIAKRNQSGF